MRGGGSTAKRGWEASLTAEDTYHDRTTKSLLKCLGEGACALAKFGSSFDQTTYRVSVQFAENTGEKRLDRMDRDLGYGKDEDVLSFNEIPNLKVDLSDVKAQLEAGGGDHSMAAHSGVSKITDAGATTGESTINQDYPVRNKEKHFATYLENYQLKGKIADKDAETAQLE